MELPEIPSEFIEPYLAKFMGTMVSFVSTAITEEELAERNGVGHTIDDVKKWMEGVELFVNQTCGIHARFAMMNELSRFTKMPNDQLSEICKRVMMSRNTDSD